MSFDNQSDDSRPLGEAWTPDQSGGMCRIGGRHAGESLFRSAGRLLAAGVGIAAGAYAAYVGLTWFRYGHVTPERGPEEEDQLLEVFIPSYEVVERHDVHVGAPAAITLAAAKEQDLFQSSVVRVVFKGRELILGATPDGTPRPHGLLAEVLSLGWGVLAEVPEREIVLGAVTKPWEPNVTFRACHPKRLRHSASQVT